MRARIAAAAARIMAEDGINDFSLAKRKAARQLGADSREGLPGNDEIETELRAYLAIYQAEEHPERVACVEKRALSDKGEALYDAKGEPLPAWEERRKLLFEYEADLVRSEEMCRELAQLGLLETFTMQAIPSQGTPLANAAVQASKASRTPTEFRWRRASWKPWDWRLVSVENADAARGISRIEREAASFGIAP